MDHDALHAIPAAIAAADAARKQQRIDGEPAMFIACPHCGAASGDVCISPYGFQRPVSLHLQRIQLWEAFLQKRAYDTMFPIDNSISEEERLVLLKVFADEIDALQKRAEIPTGETNDQPSTHVSRASQTD